MALRVYRLRRILAVTAALFAALVLGMYFYARMKVRDVRKELPNKLGIEIKQTANGFQFSKSDGKRTLFTIQASDVKEFRLNGRAELHGVNIVLYGSDSSRYDQIYGDDFAYDPKTGDVTAKGIVQIDLVANPGGVATPDQAAPKQIKNPIHLKTRDLVFNRESGNAWTDAAVEFRTPQAEGTATGVKYSGKTHVLTLASKIHVELSGSNAAVIDASSGVISNEPREITLERPHMERQSGSVQAEHAVFYLTSDNHVEKVLATGGVSTVAKAAPGRKPRKSASTDEVPAEIRGHAAQAEFLLQDDSDELRTATLSGNVHFEESGAQPLQGEAGRMILDFARENRLQTVHAIDGAHIVQRGTAKKPGSNAVPQDLDLTAPAIDFFVKNGRTLARAATLGAAQIEITPQVQPTAAPSSAQKTLVTAGRFEAQFTTREGRNRLSTIHGAPAARVVNSTVGQPDRVSTSDSIEAVFLPEGGIESLTQKGNVTYTGGEPADKRTQARASMARYTPFDQMLVLTGSPRVANGGMETTATTIHINRATGDALAQGDVKSTYSDLKEQPNGALLASSSPIHVTASTMTAHSNPGVAFFSGNARLWQDANVIEAPSIQFDRDRRFVTAQGTAAQPVQTLLVQPEKAGLNDKATASNSTKKKASASTALAITAAKLTYADSERKVHYEGGVTAKSSDFTASAVSLDAYLLSRSQTSSAHSFGGPGQLDRMVADGDVVLQSPKRRAEGQKLVYTAAEDKFVLTGGPPSIFDAEQGKITGVSLTFFRHDDRVLVEGEASSPVVTTTRVAQ